MDQVDESNDQYEICKKCSKARFLDNVTGKGRKLGQKGKENNSDMVPKYKMKNFGQISLYLSESHGLVDTQKLTPDGTQNINKKRLHGSNVFGESVCFKLKSNR